GDNEFTEGAAALGVRVALGHALAVEGRELLDEKAVVQGGDAVGSRGERVVVAGDRCTRLGRGVGGHVSPSLGVMVGGLVGGSAGFRLGVRMPRTRGTCPSR